MKLFDEQTFGGLTLKNRIAVAPMGIIHAEDGGVSPEQAEYLIERAKGGFGLIYPSAMTITDKYEDAVYSGAVLTTYSHMERLQKMVEEIHRYGAKVAVQLTPGYGRVHAGPPGMTTHVSASENTVFAYPDHTCKALTVEEIQGILQDARRGAAFAKEAGVDIVEIHGYGGYLLDQFLSKCWNHCTDAYGGSLENRMRFLLEFTSAIRDTVGPDYPISIKYTPDHCMPGGRTLDDEGIEIAKILDGMGFAYIHLDVGCYEVWNRAIPSEYDRPGSQLFVAERLREEGIKTPFMVQGKLNDPELAEHVVASGTADLIALGHQALADPFWPRKVKAGRFQDINYCISCNECLCGHGCAINPLTCHEREYMLSTPKKLRKILVVGGGPGGLYTAALAAKQGHDVTLWEKGTRLGGLANAAAGPDFKQDMRRYIDHLIADVYQSGVKVRFMHTGTPEKIDTFGADAVILAAGAEPARPNIPGIDGKTVITAEELLVKRPPVGKNVVVLGGGVVGCETALHLDDMGKNVTIIEMQERLMMIGEMANNSRIAINTALHNSLIQALTKTVVTKIQTDRVLITGPDGEREILCDNVILAIGFRSRHVLEDTLKHRPYAVFTLGDYRKPGKVYHAVHDGYHIIRLLDDIVE